MKDMNDGGSLYILVFFCCQFFRYSPFTLSHSNEVVVSTSSAIPTGQTDRDSEMGLTESLSSSIPVYINEIDIDVTMEPAD